MEQQKEHPQGADTARFSPLRSLLSPGTGRCDLAIDVWGEIQTPTAMR